MSYYPTIEEDLTRAKEILAKGRLREADLPDGYPAALREEWARHSGTIFGADIYAAYKLLESFVAEIEEYQRSFALFHRASTALRHAYARAHPDVPHLVWPDTTKVNEWAAAEIEQRNTRLSQLQNELFDSMRCGLLFGHHDEPIDEAGKRLLRVIAARLDVDMST